MNLTARDLGSPDPSFEDWWYDERPSRAMDAAKVQLVSGPEEGSGKEPGAVAAEADSSGEERSSEA